MLEQLDEAVSKAFDKFKEEYGENTKLENGDNFVTVFNDAVLIISLEENNLTIEFIDGKPFKVDMTLNIGEEK